MMAAALCLSSAITLAHGNLLPHANVSKTTTLHVLMVEDAMSFFFCRRDLGAIIVGTGGVGKAAKEAQRQLKVVATAEANDRMREREAFGRAFAMVRQQSR